MRIAFVISTLNMGGAERVLSLLANGLAERGHNITIYSFSRPGTRPYYALDEAISVVPLGLSGTSSSLVGALANNAGRIRVLRRELRELSPDAVLPLMDATNIITILACAGLGIPVLAAEHIDPARHDIGRIWNTLRNITYPFARRVLLLTSGIDAYFPEAVRKRCRVMPNPVVVDCGGPTDFPLTAPAIIGLGRLADQKGFDILIKAFALIADNHPDAKVWILGEGDKRAELEKLTNDLGLADRVHLPGAVDAPGAYLAQADIFAMPSRYEGFPIALCEALACGVATVATEFSAGARDILDHENNALVIEREDVDGLAKALDTLLTDKALRDRLAEKGLGILNRYGLDPVLDKWEALLGESIANT